jgi:hypothetical protein
MTAGFEHFIMSFGANLEVEEEKVVEDTHCMSAYGRIKQRKSSGKVSVSEQWRRVSSGKASVSDDNISESTDAGSAGCQTPAGCHTPRSVPINKSLEDFQKRWDFYRGADSTDCHTPVNSPTSKSHEEFWHFYRGADSLATMSCSMSCSTPFLEPHGLAEEVKPTTEEAFPKYDYWKLPLAPLPDDDAPQPQACTSPKSTKKVGITRPLFGRAFMCIEKPVFEAKTGSSQGKNQIYTDLAEQIYFNGWD